MGSRTVSLETSAYERLKAAKTPGKSFSEPIHRIRAPSRPAYRQLSGLLTPSETKRLKAGDTFSFHGTVFSRALQRHRSSGRPLVRGPNVKSLEVWLDRARSAEPLWDLAVGLRSRWEAPAISLEVELRSIDSQVW